MPPVLISSAVTIIAFTAVIPVQLHLPLIAVVAYYHARSCYYAAEHPLIWNYHCYAIDNLKMLNIVHTTIAKTAAAL